MSHINQGNSESEKKIADQQRRIHELERKLADQEELLSMLNIQKIEQSATFGKLGEAIESLMSLPEHIKKAHLKLNESGDYYDNRSKLYSASSDTVYQVQNRRSLNWKFSHDCSVTVFKIQFKQFM